MIKHVARRPLLPIHLRRTDLIAGILLSGFAFIGLFPYLFMLIASLKDNAQFFHSYWIPTWPLHLDNYTAAWHQISGYLINSLLIAGVSMVGVLLLGSIAAFLFARYTFIGRNTLFLLIASLYMVPSIAGLIPLFILIRDLGWLNTQLALIVPYISTGTVVATLLMRTFFQQIPEELFEAAHLDGASGLQVYLRVLLPLSTPIIGTIMMLTLLNIWNDYFWPLLTITDDSLRTVSIGVTFFQGQNITLWGPLFAGYMLASIPLLLVFIFASRYFIAGIQGSSGGGIK